jgi:hypothetical protein
MRHLGWILVLLLGVTWAYLDLYGPSNIPIIEKITSSSVEQQDPLKQPVEAGYVPGKSPDADKAKEHIVKTLQNLPEEGRIEIISQKILVTPREDGTWTEEWIVRKGRLTIPIKIDFGISRE